MKQLLYYTTDDIVTILRGKMAGIHAQRVFIVHGKGSYVACGAADVMKEACKELQVAEFTDFSTNPKEEEAASGLQKVMDFHPDVIITIGGGSAMDVAKLIRHYAIEKGIHIPLWAIPTTAGTGAEASQIVVICRDGVKCSMAEEDFMPDAAFLYPPFTYNNDAYLTACTGFDALAQAIESYWNPQATEESEFYSLRAISNIHYQLPKCLANPETHYYRDDLLWGAYWTGQAMNIAKATAPHAYSYPFTTNCGYPHGHAVAITFPFFAKLNMENNPKKKELCWFLGLPKDADLQEYFQNYIQSIGLQYHGTNGNNVRDLLNQVNQLRLKNNPVEMTETRVNDLEDYIKSL